VGVSGPTGSGKSTFSAELRDRLADYEAIVLKQDAYFRDWSLLPGDEGERRRTSNHPRSVLWDVLVDHVGRLRTGQAVPTPVPGTRAHTRGDPPVDLGPSRVVIVEGHLLFNRSDLRSELDLSVYVETNVHERVVRRLLRDTDGGTPLDRAVAWYRRDVRPHIARYSERLWTSADVIVPWEGTNSTAVEAVANWVVRRM
jgi:uridine kinase